MTRQVGARLWIKWDPDPDAPYVDESAWLLRAAGNATLAAQESAISGSSGMVADATITLNNNTGRFSPELATGPLYAYLHAAAYYQKPGYVEVTIDGGSNWVTIMTFVIRTIQEQPATYNAAATVTLRVQDRSQLLMQDIQSLPLLYRFYSGDRYYGYTESDLIIYLLEAVGMVDGVDFVSQAYAAAHPGTPATIESGMFQIPFFWLDQESVYQEIQKLASACLGYFVCGLAGKFRYWNLATWLSRLEDGPSATWAPADYGGPKPEYLDSELYSGVVVEMAGRAPADFGDLWQVGELPTIGPGQSQDFIARFRQPAFTVLALEADTDYRAASAGGTQMTEHITVSNWTTYAQRATFTLANTHTRYHAQFRRLRIRGQGVTGNPAEEVRSDSVLSAWDDRPERLRTIGSNAYIQTRRHAETVAQVLARRHEQGRFTYTVTAMEAEPDRWLGDLVTIQNTMTGLDAPAFVTSVDWSLDRTGLKHTYRLVDARLLYPRDAYFVIGTSTLGGGSGPDDAHLFW